ncbi:bromodomain-containing protein 8-like [Planococcus citri]|uniref:bromodomain-containing protein 8-like n=1 Tax=Planococcus citri TaxID=170843 RepID=UPI0031F73B81
MQHRKVYIDDWCLMEKICLVSAVLRLGDSNWSSVCDLIKPKLQENRPWDWFTPDACEAQYKVLFDECVKPQVNDQSPALQIIQNLKTKCKVECQRKEEQQNKYLTLKKKIETFLKNGVESELIDKYYEDVQLENKEKEENLRRHQEALKKRETLKIEFEKTIVPRTPNKQETKTDGGSSPIVTSPLLSSLLNNPPAVQYRPTLSTTSFIPTKSAQSVSKSTTFEKLQLFSSDVSFKDSFNSELAEQICSLDRQPALVASSSSSTIKKLESQELINTVPVVTGSRTPVSDSCASKIETSTIETTLKSDSQNLETLGLISPNEEEYLTEVDIPPEALLEVIGDLKEGTISLDKLIRDLEATDEGVIIDKDLTTVSIPVDDSYTVESKPVEQASFATELSSQAQPTDEIKTEFMEEGKVEVSEVEVHPSDLSSSTEADKLEIEEQVVIVEDTSREEHEIRTTETDDIANIEINSVDEPVTKDESPLSVSFSSTVAISVEFDSSFSEQKSDSDTVESHNAKSILNKSSESEIDEDVKSKCLPKSVVVIKRIEDGANSNKNKKNRNKTPLEESIKEIEDVPCDVDQIQDVEKIQSEQRVVSTEQHVPVESQIVPEYVGETPVLGENIVFEKDIDSEKGEKLNDETVIAELAQSSVAADDSDVSDKFEDALQTQTEETNETCSTENIINVEKEMKSPPYADVDESFELNVSEEKAAEKAIVEDKQQDVEKQEETPVVDLPSVEIVNVTENIESKYPEPVEDIPHERIENEGLTPDDGKITETVQETVEERKKSEDNKPLPTKIIKSSRRKRKSTSETIDEPAEMSIVIAPFAVKDIETIDYDVEQFAPAHSIKTEPSDTKPEDERKEQKEATPTLEKPSIKESTPARIKSERRDTKTPEPVVMVLRRSNNKTQSPMKKMDRESRSLDNSEYMKTRKKSILLAHQRLMSHKYANAFQKPITNRQVQGYENVIYKPMDLQTIKRKIENRQINSVAEFQRDILLMLNNAKMFNRINSQVYNMAVEVEEDALRDIQLTVQTLGEGIPTETQKNIEKIRKRQSLENSKTDLKLIKRIKYSTKDNIFTNLPVKRPKLEENEDE